MKVITFGFRVCLTERKWSKIVSCGRVRNNFGSQKLQLAPRVNLLCLYQIIGM